MYLSSDFTGSLTQELEHQQGGKQGNGSANDGQALNLGSVQSRLDKYFNEKMAI